MDKEKLIDKKLHLPNRFLYYQSLFRTLGFDAF